MSNGAGVAERGTEIEQRTEGDATSPGEMSNDDLRRVMFQQTLALERVAGQCPAGGGRGK